MTVAVERTGREKGMMDKVCFVFQPGFLLLIRLTGEVNLTLTACNQVVISWTSVRSSERAGCRPAARMNTGRCQAQRSEDTLIRSTMIFHPSVQRSGRAFSSQMSSKIGWLRCKPKARSRWRVLWNSTRIRSASLLLLERQLSFYSRTNCFPEN